MMNVIIDATLNNLKLVDELQAKNEEYVRTLLDQGAKSREQALKMSQQMVESLSKQASANEAYVKEVMDLTRKTFVPSKG